ncbi:MAG: preprotein translocase subunit SecE [Acidobacteria bacterium]|nr:preprotein translocase subunit SecE [Acidobacteriota bacterium]
MESETRVETPSLGQKVTGWPASVKAYIEELQSEMRRVTWPSWKQVRATTTVVIVAVFAFGVYFFAVDLAITRVVTKIFDAFTK